MYVSDETGDPLTFSPVLTAPVVNLTVHGVGSTVRTLDLGEGGTWVSVAQFEQVLDAVVGRNDVQITFDDGNASDLEIALPRLLERGLRAEFFVLAGLLGEPGRLDAAGVRDLQRAGMSIGSHGWAHRDWRHINDAEATEEFSVAHQVLGELTGEVVSRVAIPFGSYDRHVLRRLRAADVTCAFNSDGGPANRNDWLQARTSLRHDLDAAWIERVLAPRSPAEAMRGTLARVAKRWRG